MHSLQHVKYIQLHIMIHYDNIYTHTHTRSSAYIYIYIIYPSYTYIVYMMIYARNLLLDGTTHSLSSPRTNFTTKKNDFDRFGSGCHAIDKVFSWKALWRFTGVSFLFTCVGGHPVFRRIERSWCFKVGWGSTHWSGFFVLRFTGFLFFACQIGLSRWM